MKITNINTSFGRIVPLTIKNNDWQKAQELRDVLNNVKMKNYSDEKSNKIRNFFEQILGDYNGKDGIQVRKYQDSFCLLSGEDAKEIKHIPKKQTDSFISSKIENGKQQKPLSEIKVNFSNKRQRTPNKITYSTYLESYATIQDGRRTNNPNEDKSYQIVTDCRYEEKILNP